MKLANGGYALNDSGIEHVDSVTERVWFAVYTGCMVKLCARIPKEDAAKLAGQYADAACVEYKKRISNA